MSMLVREHATQTDLAEYMGLENVGLLPEGISILLKRSNELVSMSMRNNFKEEVPEHVEAAKLAACSQCQFWLENEISPVSSGAVSSYSLGELSITYSDVSKLAYKLCTAASMYLNHQHLLYKGMR